MMIDDHGKAIHDNPWLIDAFRPRTLGPLRGPHWDATHAATMPFVWAGWALQGQVSLALQTCPAFLLIIPVQCFSTHPKCSKILKPI